MLTVPLGYIPPSVDPSPFSQDFFVLLLSTGVAQDLLLTDLLPTLCILFLSNFIYQQSFGPLQTHRTN